MARPSADPLLSIHLLQTIGATTDKPGETIPVFSDAADALRVSADVGATWMQAPTAGAPVGQKPVYGPLGTLSGGSLLMPFSSSGATHAFCEGDPAIALYAWKLGASSWREVTPVIPAGVTDSLLVTTTAEEGDVLWLVRHPVDGVRRGDAGYAVRVLRP